MSNSNRKKADQLGMPHGTAQGRLKKSLLFHFVQCAGQAICHQCHEEIKCIEDFSIDHITPWLDSDDPVELFYDLDNIAFSHLKCNCAAARKPEYPLVHGVKGWRRGCRCRVCLDAKNEEKKRYRANKK
jgi:hypothetical protein